MNFRRQRQNTLCNSTAISVVPLHTTSSAEATSMVIRMSNTFQMHFHFALDILLTDPSLPAINYTVLDRCLLLKANKQCNWISKILNAGNYTSCSRSETKIVGWILVFFLGQGRLAFKVCCFGWIMFYLLNYRLCVKQVWMNSNRVDYSVSHLTVSEMLVFVRDSSPKMKVYSCRSKPIRFSSFFATQIELFFIVYNLFFSMQ